MTPYSEIIPYGIKRVLNLLDQNPDSPTYGCFDRTFWKYTMVQSKPAISYQQLTLVVALLWKIAKDQDRERLLSLTTASIRFWSKYQHPDGSFDEWYENERSFCVTAFTTYAISEALLILKNDMDPTVFESVMLQVKKSACWLSHHKNTVVTNQMAMSMLALHNTALLTNDSFFESAYQKRKEEILCIQNDEGWFPEYGGADLGYLSLTLDALAKDYHKEKDPSVFTSLEKGFHFLKHFFNPDGTFGGEIGRRNTAYVFPHGLELMKEQLPEAALCLQFFYEGLRQATILNPLSVDDRYFSYFFMPNFIDAELTYQKNPAPLESQSHARQTIHFPNARLLIYVAPTYTAIVEFNKCGMIHVYSNNALNHCFLGYIIQTPGGTYSNQAPLIKKYVYDPSHHQHGLHLSGAFTAIKSINPMAKSPILFKLFQKWILKSPWISALFNRWVKERFILKPQSARFVFTHNYYFNAEYMEVEETIWNDANQNISGFKPAYSALIPFSPTSHLEKLKPQTWAFSDSENEKIIRTLNSRKKVTIKKKVLFSGDIQIEVA